MPKETSNYQFKKPLYSDNADIAVINENFDALDDLMTPSVSATTSPGSSSRGKLSVVLGWFANRIKATTGLSLVASEPSVTLEDCREAYCKRNTYQRHDLIQRILEFDR